MTELKPFDNLTTTGWVICLCGLLFFIVGIILIVPLIPGAFSQSTMTGITSFNTTQVMGGLQNTVVINGIAYCSLGLSFIAIGAHFQKAEQFEKCNDELKDC